MRVLSFEKEQEVCGKLTLSSRKGQNLTDNYTTIRAYKSAARTHGLIPVTLSGRPRGGCDRRCFCRQCAGNL